MTMQNISSWKEMTSIQLNWIIIRLEAGLRSNIGFTLRGDLAVLTRSAITPPKMNRFGWNLKHSQYIVGGPYFGRDPRSSDSLRGSRIFCLVNDAPFRRFPVGQISQNLNRTTSIGVAMTTFGTEFWKYYREGLFFQKSAKIPQQISRSCDIWPP